MYGLQHFLHKVTDFFGFNWYEIFLYGVFRFFLFQSCAAFVLFHHTNNVKRKLSG